MRDPIKRYSRLRFEYHDRTDTNAFYPKSQVKDSVLWKFSDTFGHLHCPPIRYDTCHVIIGTESDYYGGRWYRIFDHISELIRFRVFTIMYALRRTDPLELTPAFLDYEERKSVYRRFK